MPEQFAPLATPESFTVSRPMLAPLPTHVWVRIAMPPSTARSRMTGAPASGAGTFGVTYRAPEAKGDEPSVELMHGEKHVVDIAFARKLVHQKRAVLILGNDEFAAWPIRRLPMDERERELARQAIEALG